LTDFQLDSFRIVPSQRSMFAWPLNSVRMTSPAVISEAPK